MFQNSRLFSIVFPANNFKVDMKKELKCGRVCLEAQESRCLKKQWSFPCQTLVPTQYTLRSLLIHGTFWLQQQVLIATANARLNAVFASLKSVKEGKVPSSMSVLCSFAQDNFELCLSHLGGVGNMRDRKRGMQELIYLHDRLCYQLMYWAQLRLSLRNTELSNLIYQEIKKGFIFREQIKVLSMLQNC